MRWINLAERQPDDDLRNYRVRAAEYDGTDLDIRYYEWYLNGRKSISINNVKYATSSLEWLDIPSTNKYKGNEWESELFKDFLKGLYFQIEALPRYSAAVTPPFIGIPTEFTGAIENNAVMVGNEAGYWINREDVLKLLKS